MTTNIADSFQIALEVANDGSSKKAALAADQVARSAVAEERGGVDAASAPLPLEDAIRLVEAAADDPRLASGIDRPDADQHEAVRTHELLRSLCVVVARLADRINLAPNPTARLPPAGAGDVEPEYGHRGSLSLEDYLDEVERREIIRAIEGARHNRTEAARLLGITFRALRYRLERLGIE